LNIIIDKCSVCKSRLCYGSGDTSCIQDNTDIDGTI
jgi:hypothetical protein